MFSKSSEIPFCLSLKYNPFMPNFIEDFRYIWESFSNSKSIIEDEWISWVIDRSWLIQELRGLQSE